MNIKFKRIALAILGIFILKIAVADQLIENTDRRPSSKETIQVTE